MQYNDGFSVDDNLKFIKCPVCENEEFSDDAEHCRICGFDVYNYCAGCRVEDVNGNYLGIERHKNKGNARYCETCGEETVVFKARLLAPYTQYLDNIHF